MSVDAAVDDGIQSRELQAYNVSSNEVEGGMKRRHGEPDARAASLGSGIWLRRSPEFGFVGV
jgi:hypothetical protein